MTVDSNQGRRSKQAAKKQPGEEDVALSTRHAPSPVSVDPRKSDPPTEEKQKLWRPARKQSRLKWYLGRGDLVIDEGARACPK